MIVSGGGGFEHRPRRRSTIEENTVNIYSSIYPELLLVLPSGSIQFTEGSATVTDEKLAGEVRELAARAEDLGLIAPEAEAGDEKPGKKSGKKADEELV
nr:MAG TPA: hypothetical protein [Caudoviricetes sp.]